MGRGGSLHESSAPTVTAAANANIVSTSIPCARQPRVSGRPKESTVLDRDYPHASRNQRNRSGAVQASSGHTTTEYTRPLCRVHEHSRNVAHLCTENLPHFTKSRINWHTTPEATVVGDVHWSQFRPRGRSGRAGAALCRGPSTLAPCCSSKVQRRTPSSNSVDKGVDRGVGVQACVLLV